MRKNTFYGGELECSGVQRLNPLGLHGDVSFLQAVLLQQIINLQKMLPKVLGQQLDLREQWNKVGLFYFLDVQLLWPLFCTHLCVLHPVDHVDHVLEGLLQGQVLLQPSPAAGHQLLQQAPLAQDVLLSG